MVVPRWRHCPPDPARAGRLRTPAAILAAALVPLALSVAWVPARSSLPNVDLALVLVVAAAAIGTIGSRAGVATVAVCSALWFEFFDTVPYERLSIARNPDIETTLVLVMVAALVGELSFRVARHRRYLRYESEKVSGMRSAAALVASGEDLAVVIEQVASTLSVLLRASSCSFSSEPALVGRLRPDRDGRLRGGGVPVVLGTGGGVPVDLPVIVQGRELGRFELTFAGDPPAPDRWMVAVTLADNVGAAFLAQAPPPLPPDEQLALPLRLYGREPARRAGGPGGPQETSGAVSAAR